MDVLIRDIETGDYPSVVALWNCELGNRAVSNENFTAVMERMNAAGHYYTLIAQANLEIVGFISVVTSLAFGFPVGYVHVQGLAVRRDYQKTGVGAKLMDAMEERARKIGASSIILCSGMKRVGAHGFYLHQGYDKDSYCFDKLLNRP